MDRRSFLQVSVPATLGITSGVRAGDPSGPPGGARTWTLGNRRLKLALSEAHKGGLSSFIDVHSRRNFIAKAMPLYKLSLVQKGKDTLDLTSEDAESLEVNQSTQGSAETLRLTYGRHHGLDLTVVCTVSLAADSPLSHWKISVKNNTLYGIRAIRYPIVHAPMVLGDSGHDDCFMNPGGGGELVKDPTAKHFYYTGKEIGIDRRGQYPGSAVLQVQAFYDPTAGIYMAAHDAGINIKHFGMKKMDHALDLSIEHNYDERPGLSFDLPYETALGVFQGDWYAAADLYKEWASQQPWCAKKTSERDDLPAWLKEPRPAVQYECRGEMQRCRGLASYPPTDFPFGKFWPAKKVLPLSRKYAEIFDSPVLVWYNGWEKIGNPSGPVDNLPPLEGAESLKAAMQELSNDGYIPYMAAWGNHWIYKRRGAGYDGSERFEREGAPLAAVNHKGEIPASGSAEYTFATLCNGSEKVQEILVNYFAELLNLGAVALELDHQAWPSECYSDQHGHAPGYGPWMGQRTTKLLAKIRAAAKKHNPNGTLSFEGSSEGWIQTVDFMLDRPYMPSLIPLFTYVYHEYVPLLSGDGPFGVTHVDEQLMQHATNFVYGHLSFVMVGLNDYDFEVNPDYPIFTLLRNIVRAQRTYARDYVVLGSMMKPTPLKTASIMAAPWRTWEEADPALTVEVPKVLHSVWQGPEKTGYVVVNWSGGAEEVTLGLVKNSGEAFILSGNQKSTAAASQVSAGEITLSVPARGVVLVEQA